MLHMHTCLGPEVVGTHMLHSLDCMHNSYCSNDSDLVGAGEGGEQTKRVRDM